MWEQWSEGTISGGKRVEDKKGGGGSLVVWQSKDLGFKIGRKHSGYGMKFPLYS